MTPDEFRRGRQCDPERELRARIAELEGEPDRFALDVTSALLTQTAEQAEEIRRLQGELEAARRALKGLKVAIATAGIPIEAMFLSGADRWHCDALRQGFLEAQTAIRAALAQPEPAGESADG